MKAPVISSWFGRGAIAAPPDIESAALRSDRFRLEREGEWRRLEDIVKRMEGGGLKRIADDDLLALPTLYRTAASSLSVARETSLDAARSPISKGWCSAPGSRSMARVRAFQLAARVPAGRMEPRRARNLARPLHRAVRDGGRRGCRLAARRADEEWYYRLVPGGLADTRVPGASREELLATLGTEESAAGLSTFAAQLFSNNSAVCILAFAWALPSASLR
jgi:hypothetical protein